MSVLSLPARGAIRKPVEAVRDNTARDEHPRLRSHWSIGKNENLPGIDRAS